LSLPLGRIRPPPRGASKQVFAEVAWRRGPRPPTCPTGPDGSIVTGLPPPSDYQKIADDYLAKHAPPDHDSLAKLFENIASAAWYLGSKAEREHGVKPSERHIPEPRDARGA